MKSNLSILSLIIANLFPIFGVLFWQWELANILFIYWFENIVIGLYNVVKMIWADQPNQKGMQTTILGKTTVDTSKQSTVLFFLLHYGFFTFSHGLFLSNLFSNNFFFNPTLTLGILFLFVSHGISTLINYFGKKEYLSISPEQLMVAPYKRVMIIHFTVILAGLIVVNINGQAFGALIALVLVKTVADLLSHNFEHNQLKPSTEQNNNKKVITFNLNPGLVKKFVPNYETLARDAYNKSVESGKWNEIKATLDLETVKKVEDYWSGKNE